jgi:hypothetical protein
MATKPLSREAAQSAIDALNAANGSVTEGAKLLGIPRGTFNSRVLHAKGMGLEAAPRAIAGTSTLYGPDGEVRLQWVKENVSEAEKIERIKQVYADMAEGVPRQPKTPKPKNTNRDLCNVYTMTDCHMGMLAWKAETGADWDIKIAERVLVGCFMQMLQQSPDAEVGIVNQLGDFNHTDGLVPMTPTSGHILDQDGRFSKIVRTTIKVLRMLINAALEKHKLVHVVLAEGNHDPASSVWLRELFVALYENEPRVVIDTSVLPFYVYQHGQTMLAFHHGHLVKSANLPLLFAAKYPKLWGDTLKRYCHTGHRHHVEEKEHPGIKMIQHPTLAAPDAYAARNGYLSEREATAITYHSQFGQVARTTVTPEMIA